MADYAPAAWRPGDSATSTQVNALSSQLDEEEAINSVQAARLDRLDSSMATMPRWNVVAFANSLSASGNLFLNYFTADRSMTVTNVTFVSGNTAAGATPTLVRWGIYSVSLMRDLTLIASTPNDTSLYSVALTTYTKALSASVDLTVGNRYAAGALVVTAAALPTWVGCSAAVGSAEYSQPKQLNGIVSGQTDLPASVTASSIATTANGLMYVRLS